MLEQTQVDTFREKGFLLGNRVLSDEQVDELREELARVIDDYERDDVAQPVRIANLGGKEESPVWQIVNIWGSEFCLSPTRSQSSDCGRDWAAHVGDRVARLARPNPIQTAESRGCESLASRFTIVGYSHPENESSQCLGCVGRCR